MFKKVVLIAAPIALSLLLVGCSQNSDPTPMIDDRTIIPTEVSASYNATAIESSDIDPALTNAGSPVITNLTEDSFTITQAGSSTCQNVIEQILIDNESNHIKIVYESLHEERACTDDLKVQGWDVTLNDPFITNPDEVLFDVVQVYPAVIYDVTIIGNDGEIRLSGVQPHSHDEGDHHTHEEGHSHEGHTHEEDGHTHEEHEDHSHE